MYTIRCSLDSLQPLTDTRLCAKPLETRCSSIPTPLILYSSRQL